MTRTDAWHDALDAYEVRLTAVAEAVAEGTPTAVPPFEPPPDLSPLPAALVDRATALLDRTHDLTRLIEQGQTAIRARLDAEPTTPRAMGETRFDVTV